MYNFENSCPYNSEHFNHVMNVQCSEASCHISLIIFHGMHKFRASDCVHRLGTSFTLKISHLAPRLRKRRTKEVNYSSLNLVATSLIVFPSALESRVELWKGFVLFSFFFFCLEFLDRPGKVKKARLLV